MNDLGNAVLIGVRSLTSDVRGTRREAQSGRYNRRKGHPQLTPTCCWDFEVGADAINGNSASFVARHPDLVAVLFRHRRASIRASLQPMQDHCLNHPLRVGQMPSAVFLKCLKYLRIEAVCPLDRFRLVRGLSA